MGQKTILLVEDDAGQEAQTRQALSELGIRSRLEVVHDGVEALDYLFAMGVYSQRDPEEVPSLILLDLTMPKMGGLHVSQVLRRVRTSDRSWPPPIVVMTSSESEAEQIRGQPWGPFTALDKTSDFDELVESLRRIVQHWLGEKELPAKRVVTV